MKGLCLYRCCAMSRLNVYIGVHCVWNSPNFVSIDIVQYCENISFRIIMGMVCELRDKIYIYLHLLKSELIKM